MRLPVSLVLALLLLPMTAFAQEETSVCAPAACFRETRAGPDCGSDVLWAHAASVHLHAEGRRDCPDERNASGHALVVSLVEPEGQETLYWEEHREEGADYRTVTLARPPRFFAWHEDRYGCTASFSVAGERRLGCPAGPPPAPPRVAWGHLLP